VAIGWLVAATVLDAIVLIALLNHPMVGEEQSSGGRALRVLVLVPLLRLVTLMLALKNVSDAGRYVLEGIPLLVAALAVGGNLRRWQRRFSFDKKQATIAAIGALLSLPAYYIARPPALFDPMGPLQFAAGVVILVLFVGATEELIFRGAVQTALVDLFPRTGVLWASVLFASVYLAVKPVTYIPFIAALGLGWGIVVKRTGTVSGSIAAHGLLLVGLLLLWPSVLG